METPVTRVAMAYDALLEAAGLLEGGTVSYSAELLHLSQILQGRAIARLPKDSPLLAIIKRAMDETGVAIRACAELDNI